MKFVGALLSIVGTALVIVGALTFVASVGGSGSLYLAFESVVVGLVLLGLCAILACLLQIRDALWRGHGQVPTAAKASPPAPESPKEKGIFGQSPLHEYEQAARRREKRSL